MRARMFAVLVFGVLVSTGFAGATASTSHTLPEGLRERFAVSSIEVQSRTTEGVVVKRGVVFALEYDGVPAKRLRFVQANSKSPRFHVRDYAQVEIAGDRIKRAEKGDFALARGTRPVVLETNLEANRLHLLTHTAEPVVLPRGIQAYGCTGFIFHLDPPLLTGRDAAGIDQTIGRWLVRTR